MRKFLISAAAVASFLPSLASARLVRDLDPVQPAICGTSREFGYRTDVVNLTEQKAAAAAAKDAFCKLVARAK